MQLKLIRKYFTEKSTIGELFIDDVFECFTLEDIVREEKVKGETAIPYGKYPVKIDWSPKFKKNMPRLSDVKDFEGVLIHWGNTAANSDGCILVGQTKAKDFIGSSKAAFKILFDKLQVAEKASATNHIEIIKG